MTRIVDLDWFAKPGPSPRVDNCLQPAGRLGAAWRQETKRTRASAAFPPTSSVASTRGRCSAQHAGPTAPSALLHGEAEGGSEERRSEKQGNVRGMVIYINVSAAMESCSKKNCIRNYNSEHETMVNIAFIGEGGMQKKS